MQTNHFITGINGDTFVSVARNRIAGYGIVIAHVATADGKELIRDADGHATFNPAVIWFSDLELATRAIIGIFSPDKEPQVRRLITNWETAPNYPLGD